MYENFKIILHQCEKQAEKLISMEIDEDYFTELEIFDNYFNQLKQIIEFLDINIVADSVINLKNLMSVFYKKMEDHNNTLSTQLKNIKKNKTTMTLYGQNKSIKTAKFDKLS